MIHFYVSGIKSLHCIQGKSAKEFCHHREKVVVVHGDGCKQRTDFCTHPYKESTKPGDHITEVKEGTEIKDVRKTGCGAVRLLWS